MATQQTKKRKKQLKDSIKIADYHCVNADKLDRVINGVIGSGGQLFGGIGEDADPVDILAHYDKLGGLILNKEGYTVKRGSFWDIKGKKPQEKPKIILLFRGFGEVVEVEEGKKPPLDVVAAEIALEKKREKVEAKQKAKAEAKEERADKRKKQREHDDE